MLCEMSPVHICGMAMEMSEIQNRGMVAEQEAMIATETESGRGEACHIIRLAILLPSGIHTMNNSHHQDPCIPDATRADAAHVWSLARSSTVQMTTGSRMIEHLRLTAANPARAHLPRTALGLCPEITMILTSGIPRAMNLRLHSAMPRITFSPKKLPDIVVLRLTKIRQMLRLLSLANPALVRHSLLRLRPCLHRRSHVSRHKSRLMDLVESRLFLGLRL
jgi:hypothetical protein